MGNAIVHSAPIAPPPRDKQIDRYSKLYLLDEVAMAELWRQFCLLDRDGKGKMKVEDLFGYLQTPLSPLTTRAIDLIDTKSSNFVTFPEFVAFTCTLASMGIRETLDFAFFAMDIDKVGTIDKHEAKQFMRDIWIDDVNANTHEAIMFLEDVYTSDGRLTYNDIMSMAAAYPNAFYPIYRLQTQVVTHTFGTEWWVNKNFEVKEHIEEERQKALRKLHQDAMEKEREEEIANEKIVYQRMGFVKYYLCFCMRKRELQKAKRIAMIAEEMARQQVDKLGQCMYYDSPSP
jgi:Ca2+-binding EF-hand superfamily protein